LSTPRHLGPLPTAESLIELRKIADLVKTWSMRRLLVLFGGTSNERLVSVASAQNVTRLLPGATAWFMAADESVTPVDVAALHAHQNPFVDAFRPSASPAYPSIQAALDAGACDGMTVFLALHGGSGEDGSLQAAFERRGVAFTGSGSAASALAFDKALAKQAVGRHGGRLAQAERLEVMAPAALDQTLRALLQRAPRWVLKPVADGSSYGLVHLTGVDVVPQAVQTVTAQKTVYLAERFVTGRELTVGVVDFAAGRRALPVSEVRLKPGHAFDYANKYLAGTEEITPALLSVDETKAAQQLAKVAHDALGCAGYSRTDMILSAEGPVFLETNTLPGLTKASFIPQQLAAEGTDVKTFFDRLLDLAEARVVQR
jgi:D-alanine-D-alanine ligase